MKKLLAAVLSAALLVGCSSSTHTEKNTDEKVTITENVELLATKTDMSGYRWIGDEVGEFYETSLKESTRLFSEKGTGILYYGYVGCKWCERAIPELNEVAKETGVKIYYIDAAVQPPQEDYQALVKYLDSILEKDSGGEAQFFVPLVVGVKNGEITGSHAALVKGFEITSDSVQMNDSQKEELRNYYRDIIHATAD